VVWQSAFGRREAVPVSPWCLKSIHSLHLTGNAISVSQGSRSLRRPRQASIVVPWQFEDAVSVSFAYHLVGRGWAECTVAIAERHATMTASYLSDAFGDLLGAVIRVVEGQPEAMASFAEEPGEYRWRFFRKEPDRVLIRVLDFPELWSDRPDEEGKILIEAECRLRTFAGAVLSESQRLLAKHGREGYLGMWHQHEFPVDKQERLRQLLRQKTL
jgi:hypothetical protein